MAPELTRNKVHFKNQAPMEAKMNTLDGSFASILFSQYKSQEKKQEFCFRLQKDKECSLSHFPSDFLLFCSRCDVGPTLEQRNFISQRDESTEEGPSEWQGTK